jgi:hypothetical protein
VNRTWKSALAGALVAPLLALCIVAPSAEAGSGLNTFYWSTSGYTVSSTSYRYSNMSGFVQALANSNGCPLTVDGIYGNQTTWYTAVFQNQIVGTNNGGVMNPSMWLAVQSAKDQWGFDRLGWGGAVDAYGTQYWGYYGGGASGAALGWNPFNSQWLFGFQGGVSPSRSVQLGLPA